MFDCIFNLMYNVHRLDIKKNVVKFMFYLFLFHFCLIIQCLREITYFID